jgi:hypothetical protein
MTDAKKLRSTNSVAAAQALNPDGIADFRGPKARFSPFHPTIRAECG